MDESFVLSITEHFMATIASSVLQLNWELWGLKSELKNLQDTLAKIQPFVSDAEIKKAKNRHLSDWLFKLKDALYDAEDLFDEIEYELSWRQLENSNKGMRSKVHNFFSFSNQVAFRHQMGHKFKMIREKLNEILDSKSKFQLVEREDSYVVMNARINMSSSSLVRRPSIIIGRDKDKEEIIQLLMHKGDPEDVNVSIIPIVGPGGIGKTTLAQLVYNEERVKQHFEIKAWVCVSYDFDLENIIQSVGDENWNGKKFLLILDDVLNEDRGKWLELEKLLRKVSSGSKIVMTTRSMMVAYSTGSKNPYLLSALPDKESMSLLEKLVFEERQEKQHENLMNEIMRKCRGLPLALKILGSLLHLNTDKDYWLSIRDNEVWQTQEWSTLAALQISYEALPSYLKHCFSRLSLFPKDYEFTSLELIQLWMAQGLIMSSDNDQELEEIGQQYVDELLLRSFIQASDLDSGFKMHDLMHDLALLVAQHECWSGNFQTQHIPKMVRHVSFCDSDLSEEEVLQSILDLNSSLRTITFPIKGVGVSNNSFVETCISRFKYLQVLDMSDSSFKTLPIFISKLKHLRLLNLSNNRHIRELPKSISKLQKMQTLRLSECLELEKLPTEIQSLTRLRFLYVTTKQMPLEIKSLARLRFLSISDCTDLKSLEVMECPPALKTLWIINCKSLECLPSGLSYLTVLKIIGCPELGKRCQPTGEDWDKIKHIQEITVDSQKIQLPGNKVVSGTEMMFEDISSC